MEFDYSKLLGKITEKFGTNTNFATIMKISDRTISLKLNNKVEWKQKEIQKAKKILEIPDAEVCDYFFKVKVQTD